MSQYKILSFDPGLSTLGYADSLYDTDTNIFEVNRIGTFKATKQALKEKNQSNIYGYRLISLNMLEDEVRRLIEFFKPDYIASEDIFCHIKHVNAFAALTLCLHTMRHAAFMCNKTIYTIAPCDIKKEVADNGHADKTAIQKALLENKNIKLEDNKYIVLSKMCEHEADAIAVGYSFAVAILPNILLSDKLSTEFKEDKEDEKKEKKIRKTYTKNKK